jgi:tetratricopeptide (TPR) repeat protein
MNTRLRFVISAFVILACLGKAPFVHAAAVQAWRGKLAIPTYSLGPADPNPSFPLINSNDVYPYTMLDDLTDDRILKTYNALYLENQYLKVIILPELGGHVYSLYDKVDHREVLYRNHVVKYGLVGPRGAWVAGGIEFSFPYAHTMNTVSPVESTIRHNPDGSASVIVGAIDRVSNMYSEIALTLRPDAARLQEDVTLFNATPQANLYLFWTNAAVKATEDLQYVYPMREIIDDDPFAIVRSWPLSNGIDKSWYKNDPEAMAVFGRAVHRDFFGVYYHESNYGVIHVADFRQDPGKKIWTWGTARSGRIWDKLLSDEDGPYNEIQSGRFPTQGFREFMEPRRIEKWTEYWYPINGLKDGFVDATSQMAINVSYSEEKNPKPNITVTVSPAEEAIGATILIKRGDTVLKVIRAVHLLPLHSEAYTVPVQDVEAAKRNLEIEVTSATGLPILHWSADGPIDGNPDFVPHAGTRLQSQIPDSAQTPTQALYLRGVFLQKEGNRQGALKVYEEVLQRDPDYIPALLREAWYHYQAGDLDQAEQLIARAINRDETNSEAQYASGVVHRAEGRLNLATDEFWTSIHYGGSAAPVLVELGEIEIRQRNYPQAAELLKQAVSSNPEDAFALADLSVAERLSGKPKDALAAAEKATALMPLLPYALAERFEDQQPLAAKTSGWQDASSDWKEIIGSDPQNYLAVAAWYHSLGAWQSADLILRTAEADPSTSSISPLVNYYLASDARHEGNPQAAAQFAGYAAEATTVAVFPNRLEDSSILLETLQSNPGDSQAKYELGNFLFAHERYDEAASLWREAIKEGFNNSVILRNMGEFERHVTHQLSKAAEDYSRAISLSPNEYRLYSDLDEIYEEENNMTARRELFQKAPERVLDHDTVRARRVIFLIETKKYKDALTELANHNFKPWEGGVSFHNLYVSASMQSGQQALADRRPAQAEKYFRDAMRYPENLGTGAPSVPATSEQLYWLGNALEAESMHEQAKEDWVNAANQGKKSPGSCQIFSALSFEKFGEENVAREMLRQCIRNAEQPSASAGAFFNAGMAEKYSENAAGAREEFHRALAVDPLYWRARIALAATE